jgi:hypothetical protein
LGGAILLNVFVDELPPERHTSLGWFTIGLITYTGAVHFDREASPACYLAVSILATSGSLAALVSTRHRAAVTCLVRARMRPSRRLGPSSGRHSTLALA